MATLSDAFAGRRQCKKRSRHCLPGCSTAVWPLNESSGAAFASRPLRRAGALARISDATTREVLRSLIDAYNARKSWVRVIKVSLPKDSVASLLST